MAWFSSYSQHDRSYYLQRHKALGIGIVTRYFDDFGDSKD